MRAELRDLLDRAKRAGDNAHAPYFRKPQGAALETADGSIYTGASLELSCMAGSVSAEVAALGAAVADGHRDFNRLVCWPSRFPYGDALQMFKEFGSQLEIITEGPDGAIVSRRLSELLPF